MGMTQIWTREKCLEAGRVFMAKHGRVPLTADLGRKNGLPSKCLIWRIFSSIFAYESLLGGGSYVHPVQATEAWMQTRGEKLHKLRACLRCNESFESEGAWNRICDKCHDKHDYRVSMGQCEEEPDSSWMTGIEADYGRSYQGKGELRTVL